MRNNVKIGLVLLICFMFKAGGNCYAQKFSKHEIKAAYVHNFIKFVQWPEDKTQIRLGIIGRNEFTNILKYKLLNQKIGKYAVKITHYSNTNIINNCDVLFVADDELIDCGLILSKLKGKSILSIGETTSFFNNNGMIYLEERAGGNYAFLINNSNAIEEKIIISSKLLKLAFKIK
tara:strand:+ start:2930 stop:3457 length:528 start_codon:yes stop_codon:yes gene_type:complete